MAAHYFEGRSEHYNLKARICGGVCLGGTIAFEMAQQLQQAW